MSTLYDPRRYSAAAVLPTASEGRPTSRLSLNGSPANHKPSALLDQTASHNNVANGKVLSLAKVEEAILHKPASIGNDRPHNARPIATPIAENSANDGTITHPVKYALLFNPQGSKPLQAQLTFPGRKALTPPPTLQLAYSSDIRSQVLNFANEILGHGQSSKSNIVYTAVSMDCALAETNVNSVALVGGSASHKQQRASRLHPQAASRATAPHSSLVVFQLGVPSVALEKSLMATGTHFSVDITVVDSSGSHHSSSRRRIIVNLHDGTFDGCKMAMAVNPQHCRVTLSLPALKEDITPSTHKPAFEWISVVVDAQSIVETFYKSAFKGVERVSLTGSNIQLRRVFCCEHRIDSNTILLPRLMGIAGIDFAASVVVHPSQAEANSAPRKAATSDKTVKRQPWGKSRLDVAYGTPQRRRSPLNVQSGSSFGETQTGSCILSSPQPFSYVEDFVDQLTAAPADKLLQHRVVNKKAFQSATSGLEAFTPIRRDFADVASSVECSFTVQYNQSEIPRQERSPVKHAIYTPPVCNESADTVSMSSENCEDAPEVKGGLELQDHSFHRALSNVSDVTVVLMSMNEASNPSEARRPATVKVLRSTAVRIPAIDSTEPNPHMESTPTRMSPHDHTFVSEPMSFIFKDLPSTPVSTLSREKPPATPSSRHWYGVDDWVAQTESSGTAVEASSPQTPQSPQKASEHHDDIEYDPILGCYYNSKSNTYERLPPG